MSTLGFILLMAAIWILVGVAIFTVTQKWNREVALQQARRILKLHGIQPVSLADASREKYVPGQNTFRVSYFDVDGNQQERLFSMQLFANTVSWLDEDKTNAGDGMVADRQNRGSKEQIIDELSAENARLQQRIAELEQSGTQSR